MSNGLESKDLERLLRNMRVTPAPDTIWEGVRASLDHPERPGPVAVWRRPVHSPLLAAAAALAALIVGAYAGVYRTYGAPAAWQVVALSGTPTIAGASLDSSHALQSGEWLVTDSVSRAQLAVGNIGTADVGPDSRLRIARAQGTEHRLTLERGSLNAVITAPPRLFFVETPSAVATDLGCAYTLDVDSAGTSKLHVTSGWVELKRLDRISLVTEGLVARVGVDWGPGTPHPAGLADTAQAALERLDRGTGSMADLDMVIDALAPPTAFVTVRQRSAITLWHLVQRLEGPMRARAFTGLVRLSEPPDGVTREGILALERPMLTRWRRDLNPMWSEEAQPLLVRALRRLWLLTMG